ALFLRVRARPVPLADGGGRSGRRNHGDHVAQGRGRLDARFGGPRDCGRWAGRTHRGLRKMSVDVVGGRLGRGGRLPGKPLSGLTDEIPKNRARSRIPESRPDVTMLSRKLRAIIGGRSWNTSRSSV